MDDVRAFKLPPPPKPFVTVDEKALNSIKDIALGLFRNSMSKPVDTSLLMLEALRIYLSQQGAPATFEVKFEKR
jgi:hypothetical protein